MIPYNDLLRRGLLRHVRRWGSLVGAPPATWEEMAKTLQSRYGQVAPADLTEELAAWLDDPDPLARFETVELLEELATSGRMVILPGSDETFSLDEMFEPCLRALVRATGDPVDFVRARAARALGQIGPAAAAAKPALEALLGDLSADVRRAAEDALRFIP